MMAPMDPIRITATSGRIEVTAESRGDVVVEQGQEHPMGGVLEVQGTSAGVRMRVPVGADLIIGSHSGAVRLVGDLGKFAGDAPVKAANGRVTIAEVGGTLTVTAVSRRVEVEQAAGSVHAT